MVLKFFQEKEVVKVNEFINVYKYFILYNKFNNFMFTFKKVIFMIMGIGGLGIGDWGLGIGPNPQSPIPNPPIPIIILKLFL